MKVSKLNCTACGSPISIPEDVNQIVCTSCGTSLGIERGEGYVALKIADKLASAINSSGSQTQDAIRENTLVTRGELQKLQLSHELSSTQMQLNSIQAEIRTVEREMASPRSMAQLLTLRQDEYQVMERIRRMKLQISTPAPNDLDGLLGLAEWEFAWIAAEMAALRGSALQRKAQLMVDLKNRSDNLSASITLMKIRQLKNRLPSFNLPDPIKEDLASITSLVRALERDEISLRSQRLTPEAQTVIVELQMRLKTMRTAQKRLQLERLSGELASLKQQPDRNNLGALKEHLVRVEQDMRKMSLAVTNDLTREMQKRLQEDQKRTFRQIQVLERENNRGERPNLFETLAAGIGVWVSAILADRKPEQAFRTQSAESTEYKQHAATVQVGKEGESRQRDVLYVGGGCLLAFLFLLLFFVVGVIVAEKSTGDPTTVNKNISLLIFAILIGVVLGIRVILRRSASEVQIHLFGKGSLHIRPRQPGIGIRNLNVVRAIILLSTWVSIYLLMLSIYGALLAANPETSVSIIVIGFFLSPLAAWWTAKRTTFAL